MGEERKDTKAGLWQGDIPACDLRQALPSKFPRGNTPVEKSPPLWGRDNEGGKASDWSRIQNPAF